MSPEDFNKWRVIPRILMFVYYGFFMYAFTWVAGWFMSFPFDTIDNQAVALAIMGFPTAILGVLSAVLATLTKNYFHTPGGNGGSDEGW